MALQIRIVPSIYAAKWQQFTQEVKPWYYLFFNCHIYQEAFDQLPGDMARSFSKSVNSSKNYIYLPTFIYY